MHFHSLHLTHTTQYTIPNTPHFFSDPPLSFLSPSDGFDEKPDFSHTYPAALRIVAPISRVFHFWSGFGLVVDTIPLSSFSGGLEVLLDGLGLGFWLEEDMGRSWTWVVVGKV